MSGCAPLPVPPADDAATAADTACAVEQFRIAELTVRGRSCHFSTGHWHLRVEPDLPGLALWRDNTRIDTVLQLFVRSPGSPAAAILPALRERGHIPPDDCVLVPAAMGPAPRTVSFLQVRPTGERLRRLEATPRDEIPDPPCGAYGASTHGVRYFIDDLRAPRWVVYINEGQDGTLIDPRSIAWMP